MEIQVGKNIYITIEEYEGNIKIVQGYHDKDDKFQPDFCMQRNFNTQQYTNKRSIGAYMGKGEQGVSNLLALATMINAKYKKVDIKNKETDVPDSKGVPF